MKLCLLTPFLAVFVITACATATRTSVDPAGTDGGAPDAQAPIDDGIDDPALQAPHSLGSIVLGEAHGSGGTTRSTPIVTATFLPDAMLAKSCKKKIEGGCEIQQAPKCSKVTGTGTGTGCASSEICTLDDSCTPVCKAFVSCDKACPVNEVCRTSGTTGTPGTCVKLETFDAGPIAFSGTTTTITMFPPYRFETTGQGAPFLGGSELRVQAQGALDAGFEKFDEKFTATTFLQTNPSLDKIPRTTIFGSGAVPVGWAPSAASTTDNVIIAVSGAGGTATCKMKDALAKFDIPRSVVHAAQGESSIGTAPVSISVTRQRKEIHKDKHAKGALSIATVKPDGWLELVTQSTESESFQGCSSSSQSLCNDVCVDVNFDRNNCGTCGNACASTQSCSSGTCTGGTNTCVSCKSTARAGSCSSQNTTCEQDIGCSDLSYCASKCSTASCVSSCESSYPASVTKYAPLKSCLNIQCGSVCF